MGTKYDYISLKNQYVQGTMSLRELCRQNSIPTWSTVSAKAAREGWDRLRAEFQRQIESRQLEALAQKRAEKIVQISVDTLEVIHAGILKMAEDMDARVPVMDGNRVLRDEDGKIVYRKAMEFGPGAFSTFVEKYLSLIGQPTQISENRNLNANIGAEMTRDEMREMLGKLRSERALPGPAGSAEGVPSSRTRSH